MRPSQLPCPDLRYPFWVLLRFRGDFQRDKKPPLKPINIQHRQLRRAAKVPESSLHCGKKSCNAEVLRHLQKRSDGGTCTLHKGYRQRNAWKKKNAQVPFPTVSKYRGVIQQSTSAAASVSVRRNGPRGAAPPSANLKSRPLSVSVDCLREGKC